MTRAEREQQLLDVAEEVFAERGVTGASMDDVATAAGITKPVLYDHFRSRDGLLAAGILRLRGQLHDAVAATALQVGYDDGEVALRAGLRAFLGFIERRRSTWAALVTGAVLGPEAAREVETSRRVQVELTAVLLRTLAPRATELDVACCAEGINGAAERVSVWWAEHTDIGADELADRLTALLWPGVAALRAGATRRSGGPASRHRSAAAG